MTKLTEKDKRDIVALIDAKKKQLGSSAAVGTFCKISPATISQMQSMTYKAQGDDMWLDVGAKLGWKPGSNIADRRSWKVVETTDYKSISKILLDAKNNALFLPISDLAGIGKSCSLKQFADTYQSNAVFYIRCWDWGKREFLENLCRCLGIDAGRGFKTPNALVQLVIEFFLSRSMQRPLLIIDEGDKLKGGALRSLIPIYNDCEDQLGVVIAGTENLEKEIKRGVRYQAKGYDEIDSRFGRKYIKLIGCNQNEVTRICQANGVTDANTIKELFEDCNPVRKLLKINKQETSVRVITDLRRLKRLVQREQLKYIHN